MARCGLIVRVAQLLALTMSCLDQLLLNDDDDDLLLEVDEPLDVDEPETELAPGGTPSCSEPQHRDQTATKQPDVETPIEDQAVCERRELRAAEDPAECSDGDISDECYLPGSDSQAESAEIQSESDEDPDASDDAGDEPVASNATKPSRNVFKRRKSYRSKQQKVRRTEARAAGKSKPSIKTNHKSTKNQWADLMRKRSGQSRAPTCLKTKTNSLPPDSGGVGICDYCEPVLSSLETACEPALLTASERRSRLVDKRQGDAYHYTRLRLLLMNHAFDHVGNPMYHSRCVYSEQAVSSYSVVNKQSAAILW